MKVLLLGEMSGFYSNLKDGLQELGHEVILAANGDKWKKIPGADISLIEYAGKDSSFIHKFRNYVINPRDDRRLRGYDVVQVINSGVYYYLAGYRPFENLHRYNGKVFISVAGDDYYTFRTWKKGVFQYPGYIYENNKRLISAHGMKPSSLAADYLCRRIMNKADGIIPTNSFDYLLPYKGFQNLRQTIQLPINTAKILYSDNYTVDNKVVFFHGINRPEDKGTYYIIEAMKKIADKYPNEVECIINDRMPYKEYVETMKRVNVVIDQCRGYGYGMNTLIAMALGKVVLSNAEREITEKLKGDCPIINIRPSVQQIMDSMELLIQNKSEIEIMGRESREFVERNHNFIDIAQQYIEEWAR